MTVFLVALQVKDDGATIQLTAGQYFQKSLEIANYGEVTKNFKVEVDLVRWPSANIDGYKVNLLDNAPQLQQEYQVYPWGRKKININLRRQRHIPTGNYLYEVRIVHAKSKAVNELHSITAQDVFSMPLHISCL